MKLSQCKLGEVVASGMVDNPRVGHITGLTVNPVGEVVPMVKWATEKESFPQHFKSIFLLEDYNLKG